MGQTNTLSLNGLPQSSIINPQSHLTKEYHEGHTSEETQTKD